MIRNLMRNKSISAIAGIVMGIYLIIARRSALYSLVRVIGYVLLAVGIAYAILYFFGSRRDQIQLGYAAAAVIGGLLVTWLAPTVVNLFPVLMGLCLMIAGISNLTAARDDVYPAASKIVPVLTIVLGAVILFHPGSTINLIVLLAGVALVLNGLSELDMIRRIW